MMWSTLTLLSVFIAATAATAPFETVDFDLWHKPNGWQRVGVAPRHLPHELSFAFKLEEKRAAALKQALLAASDPASPQYGNWWPKAQVEKRFAAPSAEAKRALEAFVAAKFGASAHIDYSAVGYANVLVTAGQAADALNCEFALYAHPKMINETITRTLSYELDASVAPFIAFVGGTVRFPSTRDLVIRESRPKKRWGLLVDPRVVRQFYNATNVSPASPSRTTNSFAQFIGQKWDGADLLEFQTLYFQSLIGWRPSRLVGPQTGVPGVESMLDLEYLSTVSAGVRMTVYSTSKSNGGNEPFLVWLQTVLKEKAADVPHVISVSYGEPESSHQAAYLSRVSQDFQRVGLLGTTIFFAAGDSGAACELSGSKFQPDWPASDPYVTTVGGTETGPLDTTKETINYIGGGGFSNHFTMPPWQKSTVANWEKYATAEKRNPTTFYNHTGRAYPDVSALSSGFWVVTDLIPMPVGGTSCASPSFAAIVSLVNEHRLASGKKQLGFLNPALYATGSKIFNTVTSGCNAGCASNNGQGFCALTNGYWTPAGGWGTPNYELFVQHLK